MKTAAAAAPLATRPIAFQNERRCGSTRPSLTSMPRQTRAGGWRGATACAIGASRASHSETARAMAPSSRIQRSNLVRARPRSVPSAYSAARRSASSGLLRKSKAVFQAKQAAPHPGLDRAERLAQVVGELRVRQAVIEGEGDGLAL